MALDRSVALLVYLLVGGLVVYLIHWIVGMLDINASLKKVILLVVAVVVIIWLLATFIPGVL